MLKNIPKKTFSIFLIALLVGIHYLDNAVGPEYPYLQPLSDSEIGMLPKGKTCRFTMPFSKGGKGVPVFIWNFEKNIAIANVDSKEVNGIINTTSKGDGKLFPCGNKTGLYFSSEKTDISGQCIPIPNHNNTINYRVVLLVQTHSGSAEHNTYTECDK